MYASAYVSIRQHTSAYEAAHVILHLCIQRYIHRKICMRQHTLAYVSIRQHTKLRTLYFTCIYKDIYIYISYICLHIYT